MFERFTDSARHVIVHAQEQSQRLGHGYIGTEHLLLGLIATTDGVAARVLETAGVDLDTAFGAIEQMVGGGRQQRSRHIPFTPGAKRVLEQSVTESHRLGHDHIGTEHVLLALIESDDGAAGQVLTHLGIDVAGLAEAVGRDLAAAEPNGDDDRAGRPAAGSIAVSSATVTGSRAPASDGRGTVIWTIPIVVLALVGISVDRAPGPLVRAGLGIAIVGVVASAAAALGVGRSLRSDGIHPRTKVAVLALAAASLTFLVNALLS